ncbi:MAG: response regulator [Candidatus Omnitrophica bacterium]|nr:response regulator [Candidatus Omnitrophota bacterium]
MRKHKILLVDDEAHVLSALERVLHTETLTVIGATSGEEALQKLKEHGADLIISDYRMPEMTGVEFLKEAKQIAPDAIRIMLTGYADLESTIKAINEGEVYRFVTKPWNNDDLRVIVKNALAHFDIIMDNRLLLEMVKRQSATILDIEKEYPGITKKPNIKKGVYMLDESDVPKDISLEDFMNKYFPETKKDTSEAS